nr:hypothetical protein [Pseudopedobacter sp.]
MRFSQRNGISAIEKSIQLDCMDEELKNSLWNVLKLLILDNIRNRTNQYTTLNPFKQFTISLWHNFYKLPIDEIPYDSNDARAYIRIWFFQADWYEIYDFIEFSFELVRNSNYEIKTDKIEEKFNTVLEREFSGFRFIKGIIVPITNKEEIGEITSVLKITSSFTALSGCNIHLENALDKLSDRKNPDYRNSIKESVSAIESVAKIISNNAKDSLGASLDKIKGKIKIHPALERGFKQIYGYTSDEDGIRHALTEESTCGFEDAKFMLVSCSAFINYLISKSEKAGIKF